MRNDELLDRAQQGEVSRTLWLSVRGGSVGESRLFRFRVVESELLCVGGCTELRPYRLEHMFDVYRTFPLPLPQYTARAYRVVSYLRARRGGGEW